MQSGDSLWGLIQNETMTGRLLARGAYQRRTGAGFPHVPQTSQSAVSRVSQPADRPTTRRIRRQNRLQRATGGPVPQTSQSAVSRVSQPADRPTTGRAAPLSDLPIGKSAIRQVGKPAVQKRTAAPVPQTSRSAVSRVSQPADRPPSGRARFLNGLPIGKSAVRFRRMPIRGAEGRFTPPGASRLPAAAKTRGASRILLVSWFPNINLW
jgi:hypothetical protein